MLANFLAQFATVTGSATATAIALAGGALATATNFTTAFITN